MVGPHDSLMKETKISETLDFFFELTWFITQEDF
jgi:hypothetical protein